MGLLIALTGLSWVPAGAYLLLNPAGDGWTATSITLGGPWLMALRFNPLSWLPQFLAGVVLGRLFGLRVDRGEIEPVSRARFRPSAGDALALGIVLFLAFARQVPYVPLRHGLLAPLALLVINDLAHGRGLLARLLSWPGFGRLSEASFSLFALQMPAGVWFCVAILATAVGTSAQLIAMIAWTLDLAVIWSELVQRPMIERLRRAQKTSANDKRLPVPATP